MRTNRRRFLTTAAGVGAVALTGQRRAAVEAAEAARPKSPNKQFGIGAIGLRYQGSVITEKALTARTLKI